MNDFISVDLTTAALTIGDTTLSGATLLDDLRSAPWFENCQVFQHPEDPEQADVIYQRPVSFQRTDWVVFLSFVSGRLITVELEPKKFFSQRSLNRKVALGKKFQKDRIAFFNDMRARLSEEAGADCQEVGPDTDGGDTMYGQHYPTHDVMLVLNNSMPTVEIMVLYKKDPAE